MPVSSPAGGLQGFKPAVLAAVTAVLLVAPTIGRGIGLPTGLTAEPAAAAEDTCSRYRPLAPAGGVVRSVSTQAELTAALAAARPGDVINLDDGVYTRIDYQLALGHRPGTASAPIVIQAAAGATPVIDAGDAGTPSRRFAVSIIRMAHISVRGLEIRNGIFGALSRGSASITFEHNHIHHLGQVGVATGGAETATGYEPSSDTVIRCNRIHHTGMLDHEFGEGIYVGTGRTGAVDRTSGVLIEGNEIHSIANEAVDVKRYTTDVTIRRNLIHDVTPYYGGAISLGLNKNDWGPANYLVEHNRIWNVSSGRHYAQAIAVAHGPTVIRNNTIWNVATSVSDSWPWTATIQVHGDDNDADWTYGFGNPAAARVDIVGNTIIGCNQGCIGSYTDPGQIRPILTVQSNIVDRPSTGDATNSTDIVVSAADLVGPVTGAADSGAGPGSGLRLRTPPPPPTTSPPQDTTTTARRSTTVSEAPLPAPSRPASSAPPSKGPRIEEAPRPRRSTSPSQRPAEVVTTVRRSDSASTTRSATTPSTAGRSATTRSATTRSATTTSSTAGRPTTRSRTNHWRRSPSDLRVFLDANLGPDVEIGRHSTPALPPGPPDAPDWLVALTTPRAPQDKAGRPTPTTEAGRPTGLVHNATTAPDQDRTPTSTNHGAAGKLPSTTSPGNTSGLATTTR